MVLGKKDSDQGVILNRAVQLEVQRLTAWNINVHFPEGQDRDKSQDDDPPGCHCSDTGSGEVDILKAIGWVVDIKR